MIYVPRMTCGGRGMGGPLPTPELVHTASCNLQERATPGV